MKPANRKISRFLIPATFLLSIIIAIVLVLTKPQARTADAREVARAINTQTVQTGTFSPTIPLFARVTTPNHAALRAAVTADVSQLLALKGSVVKQGQTLLLLDDREASLAVKQRQADLQEAQSQIDAEILQHENELYVIRNDKGERAKHNRKQIIKSHKIRLTGLKAKKLRAESALEIAQLDLQRTRITAPYTGQVTDVHVSVGDRVRPGDQLIDLYDRQSVELTATIPGRYIATIQSAINKRHIMQASAYVNEQKIEAQLDRLSGEVNPGSGGVDALFSIINNPELLPLGKSIKLQFKLPSIDEAFVVPNTALYGTNTVYKVIDNRLKAIPVTRLGDYLSNDDDIARSLLHSKNINNGDTIMTTQLPNAIENLLVKPASNQ